jgi:hypothetical protein
LDVRFKILPTNTYDEKKEKAYSCPKGYEKETAKGVYDSFYEWKALRENYYAQQNIFFQFMFGLSSGFSMCLQRKI